jgi:hypothetical protein
MAHTQHPGSLGARQRASGTYFQRSIVALDVLDARRGRTVRISTGTPPEKRISGRVVRYVLICSSPDGTPHTRDTVRYVPSSTRNNTAPCDACGSARPIAQCSNDERRARDEQMERYGIRQALRRWATQGETPEQNAIVEALRLWGRLLAIPVRTIDDERLRERVCALLVEAGYHSALAYSCDDDGHDA